MLTKYLKDVFDRDPRAPARVAAYRGGYLPTERRDQEGKLRAGRLDCVVSTSALELGVDIGALDVCVLNGYPGTVAGSLQRFGRAGRRSRTAVGVLVCTSDPLDQYLARHPDFFLGASPEHARIDPDQLLILMDHVRCAAFELPFTAGETFGGVKLDEALGYLAEQGVVHREGPRWHWIADSYPANAVSLRSIAEGNFTVIDITGGRKDVIAEVDYSAAAVTLYEGAIHMVQSAPWQVERLDWVGRKAFVRTTTADYYTDAIDYTKLKVLDEFAGENGPSARAAHGEVHVVRRVAGYKKIRYYTHENVGYGQVNLPDSEMHTTALWWEADPRALTREFGTRFEALDGFLGAAHAIHRIAVFLSLSEPRDIGRAVGDGGPEGSWLAAPGNDGRAEARTLEGACGRCRGRRPAVPADALPLRQLPRRDRDHGAALRPARAGDRAVDRAGGGVRLQARLPGVRRPHPCEREGEASRAEAGGTEGARPAPGRRGATNRPHTDDRPPGPAAAAAREGADAECGAFTNIFVR